MSIFHYFVLKHFEHLIIWENWGEYPIRMSFGTPVVPHFKIFPATVKTIYKINIAIKIN